MSALVLTGATGFLGGAVLEILESENRLREVIVLSRRAVPALANRGVDVRVGSLADVAWLKATVPAGSSIVHMAGRVGFDGEDPRGLYDLHVETTRTLARVALDAGCHRFVVISSSGASAISRHPHLHTEQDRYPVQIVARWPYYQSKMMQERLVLDLCRREGLPGIVLAPSLLLGPGDHGGSSTDVISDFIARRLSFIPSGGISIVDVRDVAAAVVAALSLGRTGERYLLGSLNCRFSTFFDIVESCTGVAAPSLPAPRVAAVIGARLLERFAPGQRASAISPAKADMASHFWYVDWSKAARELGFAPRRPEETIRDTAAFLTAMPVAAHAG
ncbi:SDR family oxidoreductase [soil metagenome]